MIGETTAHYLAEPNDSRVVDSVERAITFGPARDDALSSKLPENPRDARLFEIAGFDEVLNGTLSLHQEVQDSQSFWIAQGSKSRRNEVECFVREDRMRAGFLSH